MISWVLVLPLIVALGFLALAHAELRQRHFRRRDLSQREYSDNLRRLGFPTIEDYRKSDLWSDTKRRYRNSDYPQRCLICGSKEFDLHHRTYARLGAEEMFDLVPLCRDHHDELHRLLDPNPDLCVKDTHDYLIHLKRDKGGLEIECPAKPNAAAQRRRKGRASPGGSRRKTQAGKRWLPEEDALLLRGFDDGVPVEHLAEQLHRGVRAVEVRLFKLGRIRPNNFRKLT